MSAENPMKNARAFFSQEDYDKLVKEGVTKFVPWSSLPHPDDPNCPPDFYRKNPSDAIIQPEPIPQAASLRPRRTFSKKDLLFGAVSIGALVVGVAVGRVSGLMGAGGGVEGVPTAVATATIPQVETPKPAVVPGSPGPRLPGASSPIPSPETAPAPKPAEVAPSPKPNPSPDRPRGLPTPRTQTLPKTTSWLPDTDSGHVAYRNAFLISHEDPLAANLIEIQQAPVHPPAERLVEGLQNWDSGKPDAIRLDINSDPFKVIDAELKKTAGSIFDSADANDAMNMSPTTSFQLDNTDEFSAKLPSGSLGVDPENWSSLKGKVEAWAMDDFFKNHDAALINEMKAAVAANPNLQFFGDEEAQNAFWKQIESGNIQFDPQNGNHIRAREILMSIPKGQELLNKQFIGGYVNAKLNNPEDPANLGAIFNKNNSDYFRHGVPLKIAEPEKLMTDLRKAA